MNQELCTVQSARLVVVGVMLAAVVHMIPRMADRQYFISSLGNNKESHSRTMMTDQSSQIQARTANISALWAWPLYTSTLALTGTSLSSSGKFWQCCNIANRFDKTLQVSRDIRAFDTLYIFGKLHITLFKQHFTIKLILFKVILNYHLIVALRCEVTFNICHELTDWNANWKDFIANSKITQKSGTTEEETSFQKEEEESEQQLPHRIQPACWGGGAHEDRSGGGGGGPGAGQEFQQGQGNMEQWGHIFYKIWKIIRLM